RPGRVRSDVVALDEVAVGLAVGDRDAVVRIPGDQVALARGRAADGVHVCAEGDRYASVIRERRGARYLGADVVALDDVSGRSEACRAVRLAGGAARVVHRDARREVARDQV